MPPQCTWTRWSINQCWLTIASNASREPTNAQLSMPKWDITRAGRRSKANPPPPAYLSILAICSFARPSTWASTSGNIRTGESISVETGFKVREENDIMSWFTLWQTKIYSWLVGDMKCLLYCWINWWLYIGFLLYMQCKQVAWISDIENATWEHPGNVADVQYCSAKSAQSFVRDSPVLVQLYPNELTNDSHSQYRIMM